MGYFNTVQQICVVVRKWRVISYPMNMIVFLFQILEKGDLQVSEKERLAQSDSSFKEIANLIANMCVNPDTKRPYSSSVIENALHEAHLSLKPNRSVKQQVRN